MNMESLTVISGSGERFELALYGKEEMHRLAEVMEKFTGLAPEERRKKIIGTVNPFFPQHYQKSLQDLSAPDAAKLASALVQCWGRRSSGSPQKNEGDATVSTTPEQRETEEQPTESLRPQEGEATVRSAPEQYHTEEHVFSDTVIAAAFHYKWSLEYAAALPEQLLKRCLHIAGAAPGDQPPAQQFELPLTPEEIARAAARSAEALKKLSLTGRNSSP